MKKIIGPILLVLLFFGLSLVSPQAVEAFAGMLPAVTALLAATFAVAVFSRFRRNGRRYLLLWGIGLTFYALGTAMEAFFGFVGWNPWAFKLYYLSGALLTAAWLGQGTLQLLGRRWLPKVSLALLTLATLYCAWEVARADMEPAFMSDRFSGITATDFNSSPPKLLALAAQTVATPGGALMDPWARTIVQQAGIDVKQVTQQPQRLGYGVRKGDVVVGTGALMEQQGVDLNHMPPAANEETPMYVVQNGKLLGYIGIAPALELNGAAIVRTTSNARSITPFFNVYGVLTLAGGAIYSAFLFWRKGILYHRMLGNILIAAGALSPALGGSLSKAGLPSALYISELAGIVLIFIGYTQAIKTDAPEPVVARTQPAPAA